MGQKALLKTFAQSHGTKTFANFFAKLKRIYSRREHFTIHEIFVKVTKKLQIQIFPSNWRKNFIFQLFCQFDEKTNCAKLFFPWDVAKVFCKAFCPMGKKALQKINLTEKMMLQRKFLLNSLFSKPYRNIYYVCNLLSDSYYYSIVNFVWNQRFFLVEILLEERKRRFHNDFSRLVSSCLFFS